MDELSKKTDLYKIPHSGEKPYREFKDTSLKAAYALKGKDGEFIIQTPDSLAGHIETARRKSKKGLFVAMGATAAGILVAGGALFGINAMNEAPKNNPVAEAPADPSESIAPTETAPEKPIGFEVIGLPSVTELEISAEQTDEATAKDIISVYSGWGMAGANNEMYDLQFEGDNLYLSQSEYVTKVTDIINPVYAEALYGDNATNPLFQESITQTELQHDQIVMANFQTHGLSAENTAPYFQNLNFVSLQGSVKNSDGTTTFFVDSVREDNADANMVTGSGTGIHTRATFVTGVVDGKVKIVEPPVFVDQYS